MGKIYEFDFKPLSYNDYAKEVFQLYDTLLEHYMSLFDKYNKLCVALDEVMLLEDTDFDQYVISLQKLEYLAEEIPKYTKEEKELFAHNQDLLPFLAEHIVRRFHLKNELNLDTFSPFDPEIYKEYSSLKDNYAVIRMIRSIKYYSIYNDVYSRLVEVNNANYTEEDIVTMMPFDFTDLECLNTLNQIRETFYTEEDTHLFNKYKCLFMFMNPKVEDSYIRLKFEDPEVNVRATCPTKEAFKEFFNKVQSKTINTLIAIQNNKIIDHRKGGRLVKELNSEKAKVVSEYYKNKDDLCLLYAYILQSYPYYDLKTIEEFDHLFTEMCKNNGKEYNNVRLLKKVVDYFFRKDAYSGVKEYQRIRKTYE